MNHEAATDDRARSRPFNPWVPMAVVITGTTMVVLDTTIVNVALHQIGVDLGAGTGVEWVVSAYLLAVCASQPITGWISDRIGRKTTFMLSMAAFTAASLLSATAPNLGALVFFRILQGLGGGALVPVGMAMVLELFPRDHHGRAISVWGMAAMVAPAIGPTLGGWLVTSVSWRLLFLINVPIGVTALIAAGPLLPASTSRHVRPFDQLGLVLGTGGLSLTVLGLSQANSWGWASAATVGCLVLGVVALLAFVRHELRVEQPMIQVRMFTDRSFRLSMLVMGFVWMSNFARLVFIPLQLEGFRGETALTVGLLFFPPAVVSAVGMSVGGRLVDRIGPRTPMIVGCLINFFALLGFTQLTLTTSLATICLLLCVQGLGFGLMAAPALVAGLSDLPPELTAQGTAVRSLVNQMSGALAVASLGAVVAARMGTNPTQSHAQVAYNSVFAVASVGMAIAVVLAIRVPRTVRKGHAGADESLAVAVE